MAVPKKKKSHSKSRMKYTINHKKNVLNRSISFSESDIINLLKNKYNEFDFDWGNLLSSKKMK
jgi:hypothetical protein